MQAYKLERLVCMQPGAEAFQFFSSGQGEVFFHGLSSYYKAVTIANSLTWPENINKKKDSGAPHVL
jgi:hypothetical protein